MGAIALDKLFPQQGLPPTVLASCTASCQLDILQRLCFHFFRDLDIVRRAVAQLVLETKASCEGFALTVHKDRMACGASDVVRIAKLRLKRFLVLDGKADSRI